MSFRELLASERCWDGETQAIFEARGEPIDDCILQNREELILLCELMHEHDVRSFLEIGIWTGRLTSALHRIFAFERLAACDHGYAEQLGLRISLPPEASFLRADSDSEAFVAWRAALGHVDMVFIDANHHYGAVKRDFEINRRFSHRFLVFHDIAGASRHTAGVARFWRELDEGHKLELVRPHGDTPSMGIGVWSERPFSQGLTEGRESSRIGG